MGTPAAASGSSASATARATAPDPSMPTFTASTPISLIQVQICATTRSGGSTSTALTPSVFCTVIAVTALIA